MKVSELAAILARLDGDGEIGIERSRQSDIPGVIEVELYEVGIKRHALREVGEETYLLYPTARIGAGGEDARGPAIGTSGYQRRRPVMEVRPLVPAGAESAATENGER